MDGELRSATPASATQSLANQLFGRLAARTPLPPGSGPDWSSCIVFVIRLLDGEEVHAAENDELTVNEQTGVLTVHRIDGFDEVTTHYSPSAWASVTHRNKGSVVRRPPVGTTK
jgi:hypothetical protein